MLVWSYCFPPYTWLRSARRQVIWSLSVRSCWITQEPFEDIREEIKIWKKRPKKGVERRDSPKQILLCHRETLLQIHMLFTFIVSLPPPPTPAKEGAAVYKVVFVINSSSLKTSHYQRRFGKSQPPDMKGQVHFQALEHICALPKAWKTGGDGDRQLCYFWNFMCMIHSLKLFNT